VRRIRACGHASASTGALCATHDDATFLGNRSNDTSRTAAQPGVVHCAEIRSPRVIENVRFPVPQKGHRSIVPIVGRRDPAACRINSGALNAIEGTGAGAGSSRLVEDSGIMELVWPTYLLCGFASISQFRRVTVAHLPIL
jgi:hypothetical protein